MTVRDGRDVVETSGLSGPGVPGDKDGMPWIGFAEPVNRVVDKFVPGAPGNGYSLTLTRSEGPIYSVVRTSGPDGPVMRTARLGSGPIRRFTALFVNTTGTWWPRCWGR